MRYAQHLTERRRDLVAMIHLPALPGTPGSTLSPAAIVERAVTEAALYRDAGVGTVMLENMHDVPYTKRVGPEVTATMAVAARAVKGLGLWCGIQVLAGCNREALAVAHGADADFVRVEGFVFAHVGDEGLFDSCAGDLLRYRRAIGADEVLVFADIKKKHSSHALTADVSLAETAKAASFFLADGVIVTGSSTGEAADLDELRSLQTVPIRKLIGSGLTPDNLAAYAPWADVFIVGSYLKRDGLWSNEPDPTRVRAMVEAFDGLPD